MFSRFKPFYQMSALRLSLSLTMVFLMILGMIWLSVFWITRGELHRNVSTDLISMIDDIENGLVPMDQDERRGELYGFISKQKRGGKIPNDYMERRGRFSFHNRQDDYEAMIVERPSGLYFAARARHEIDRPLEALNTAFLTSAIGAVIASLGLGLLFGLKSQRRINRISHTLGELANGHLDARTGMSARKDDIDGLAHNLDQTAEQLQKLVLQTRNLGANIAHDLRTPLARLRAIIEKQDNDEDNPALHELDHISSTFDAIMRIARIEANNDTSQMKSLNLGEVMSELFDIFEPVCADQKHALKLENTNPNTVIADKALLTQAIANLIQNALVYGEGDITIGAHNASIFVRDQGQGVPADQFENIQKPLVRLDSTRQSEGAGLGLALVRAIADRHGAKVKMMYHEPQGFEINLNFTKL